MKAKLKVLSAGLPYCYNWKGMGCEWPSCIPTKLYWTWSTGSEL